MQYLTTTSFYSHKSLNFIFFKILISGLSGRTWNGKEKLLDALGSICLNCKDSIRNDTEIPLETIIDAVMKECRKENIVYRRHAIEAIGNILSALDIDKFEELYNIVQDILIKVRKHVHFEHNRHTYYTRK